MLLELHGNEIFLRPLMQQCSTTLENFLESKTKTNLLKISTQLEF